MVYFAVLGTLLSLRRNPASAAVALAFRHLGSRASVHPSGKRIGALRARPDPSARAVVAPGLAYLIEGRESKAASRTRAPVIAGASLWNYWLMVQYTVGLLPKDEPVSFAAMVRQQADVHTRAAVPLSVCVSCQRVVCVARGRASGPLRCARDASRAGSQIDLGMDASADRFLLDGWERAGSDALRTGALDRRGRARRSPCRSRCRRSRRRRSRSRLARASRSRPVSANIAVEINGHEIGRFVVPPTAPADLRADRAGADVGRVLRAGYNRLTFVSHGVHRVDPSDQRPPGRLRARRTRAAGRPIADRRDLPTIRIVAALLMTRARPLVSVDRSRLQRRGARAHACQAALSPVLDGMAGGAEVIYVDDGSTRRHDRRAARRCRLRDPRVRIVELAANFGQHAAFTAGFEHARGRYLVTLDADLQCDPADIPRLIEPLTRGYDLVSGVRRNRQDPAARQLFSRDHDALVTRLAGVPLHDIGCPLNAFTERRGAKPGGVWRAATVSEAAGGSRRAPRHRSRSAAPAAPGRRRASSYSTTGLVRLFMDFFVNALGDVFAWVFLIAGVLAVLLVGWRCSSALRRRRLGQAAAICRWRSR